MRPNDSLAVVIVAKNEAARIAECVRSASFADEVIVLDSGSTDRTAQIAEAAGARVVVTDWPGYGPQVARGFGLATSDWVLSLDADERIPPALQAEVREAIAAGAQDGFRVPRWSEFCGHVMHHGGWRPDRTLRLGRRALSGFTSDFLHAHMTVAGKIGELRESLVHQLPRHPRRAREARPVFQRQRARHARAREDREPAEGDRARAVRLRAHVSAEARVPRWSARIDVGDLQRGVCLLQICEAHVHPESAR
jgi:glycosyltransferase involved in cell wall biosynthesis